MDRALSADVKQKIKEKLTESSAHLTIKLISGILFVLSTFAIVVMVVFKVDNISPFVDWNWFDVTLIPGIVSFTMLLIWMITHYITYDTSIAEVDVVSPGDEYVYEKFLESVEVANIESYHEAKSFWDLLLCLAYIGVVAMGALIYFTPCSDCSTPYDLLALGTVFSYGFRLVYRLTCAFHEYYRMRNMVSEVDRWQVSKDNQRFFGDVARDLAYQVFGFGVLFDMLMWCLTLTLALFGLVWVINGDCESHCSDTIACVRTLVYTIFVVEAVYVLAGLVLSFYRRITAVESIDRLIARVRHSHLEAEKQRVKHREEVQELGGNLEEEEDAEEGLLDRNRGRGNGKDKGKGRQGRESHKRRG